MEERLIDKMSDMNIDQKMNSLNTLRNFMGSNTLFKRRYDQTVDIFGLKEYYNIPNLTVSLFSRPLYMGIIDTIISTNILISVYQMVLPCNIISMMKNGKDRITIPEILLYQKKIDIYKVSYYQIGMFLELWQYRSFDKMSKYYSCRNDVHINSIYNDIMNPLEGMDIPSRYNKIIPMNIIDKTYDII